MVWTRCKECGKECDLPEPAPNHNPLVAGKCIDCIKKMQQEKKNDESEEWFC